VRIWIASAVLVASLLLGGRAFYFEPASLEVHHYGLDLPDWPASQDGLSIALLSDLHIGSPFYDLDKLRDVVERVHDEQPDVVLLAGDYVIDDVWGGTFTPPEAIATVLARLEAPLGVYAVLGNHDWWYDGARVRRAFESVGIAVLDNRSRRLERGRFSFRLLGLGDFWEDPPDTVALVSELPEDGLPLLAFTHNPDVFPQVPPAVSLTLAGHTHGGQARLPFFGRPIVPSRYGERYAAGHVVDNGRHLFVTTGLGTSLFAVRFRVPPEIAILRLFAWSAATDG
jgi:hypothetical protein